MKGIRQPFLCAILLLHSTLLTAAPATAAPVVSSSIYYTLDISPDPGITLTQASHPFLYTGASVHAITWWDGDDNYSADAFPTLSATAGDAFSSASVLVNDGTTAPEADGWLNAQAEAQWASSGAYQGAYFEVSGNGDITFTLNYQLNAEIDSAAGPAATVHSLLDLGIKAGSDGLFTNYGLGAVLFKDSASATGSWMLDDSSSLTVSFGGTSGNDALYIDISAWTQANSGLTAVPLPPGLPLLALATTALAFLRRRV